MTAIKLDLIPHQTQDGIPYQHLHIHLTQTHIAYDEIQKLELPRPLDLTQGVVLEGRAPLWLYGYLVYKCQQAAWVGCFEPRIFSAVVATSQVSEHLPGDTLPIQLPLAALPTIELQTQAEEPVVFMNAQLELQKINLADEQQNYQTLAIAIYNRTDADAPISYLKGKPTLTNLAPPGTLKTLKLPSDLDLTREVLVFGSGPPWLYAHLLDRCQQTPWVGFYDVREQAAIVVQSQVSERPVGSKIPIVLNNSPAPAILIGGPPNSGKSVLSNALRCSLTQHNPKMKVYLHRANWDGEGNVSYETSPQLAEHLIKKNEIRLHEQENATELIKNYFEYHATATQNIRKITELTLVDVGGVPQPEKAPLVEQCTHYIVISNDSNKVQAWHDLCSSRLKPLAIIHSKRHQCCNILSDTDFLEIEIGPWEHGEIQEVPDVLLQLVLELLKPTD